jgi:hypothetical protein
VFAQVIAVMKDFLLKEPWDYIFFTGKNGSRDKLYALISKILVKQLNAKVISNGSNFVIYRTS